MYVAVLNYISSDCANDTLYRSPTESSIPSFLDVRLCFEFLFCVTSVISTLVRQNLFRHERKTAKQLKQKHIVPNRRNQTDVV